MKKLGLLGVVLGVSIAASSTAQAQQPHSKAFKNSTNTFTVTSTRVPGFKTPAPRQPVRTRKWIPGHYETRYEQIYHPGRYESVWIDPEYREVSLGFGRCIRICVSLGRHELVWREAYYTTEAKQVWVCGQWVECFE